MSVHVDDIKLAGKKQNIGPMWKVHVKDADLGEPTSFLDHVYLGCTPRECQTSKDIADNYRNMFESQISARATEKLPYFVKLGANISSWSPKWKVMRRTMLRTGEQNNLIGIESRNSML